jgi:hypothetical protein
VGIEVMTVGKRRAPSRVQRSVVLFGFASILVGFGIRDALQPDWIDPVLGLAFGEEALAPDLLDIDPSAAEASVTDPEMMQLQALGYLSGVEPLAEEQGVLVHDPERAAPGFNLVTSGHGEEALLLDMEGRVVHRWAYPSDDLWTVEAREFSTKADEAASKTWRKSHVYPNGDLLVMHSGRGILKLDRDSNLLWHREGPHHHDVTVGPRGKIYTLTRVDRVVAEINGKIDVGDDLISVLTENGSPLRELSILEALEASEFAYLWHESGTFDRARSWDGTEKPGDRELFHTNAIQVLDGGLAERLREFGRGNLLVSLPRIDVVAVVDLDGERVVWARKLGFKGQHDPTITDSGTVLLFDNKGHSKRSRIWEIDPVTDALKWRYGDAPSEEIYSSCCGTAQRLSNGNTLITETDAGRALEVDRDGTVVWEYVTSLRSLADPELVARVFEVERLPPDFGADWLSPNREWTASR